MPKISVRNVFKSYDKKHVLNDINLTFKRSTITGLLGPNGAGKTTLLSILTGIIPKDKGTIIVDGLNLDTSLGDILERSSLVPEKLSFYPMLSVSENLEYFGGLFGLYGRSLRSRLDFCIEAASLQSFLNKRASKCSSGMQRRLNLAIGLLNDPEILYLDEPTLGMDPQSRRFLIETISEIVKEKKTTVIYTSHYLEEIEQISENIAIIDNGRIILAGEKKDALQGSDDLFLHTEQLSGTASEKIGAIRGVILGTDLRTITISHSPQLNQILGRVLAILEENRIEIKDIKYGIKSLEDLFLRLTKKGLRDS
jgi:ABC-2 type transport system ATP-binding protein